MTPFWSPQSDFVGYFDWEESALKKVSVQGGSSTLLCKLPSQIRGGATWRPDGTIIIGLAELGLFTVSAQGGEPRVLLQPDSTQGETAFWWPHVLPDGRTLVFCVQKKDNSHDLVVQAGDTRTLLVHAPPVEEIRLPAYSPTGHLLYSHRVASGRTDVWAAPFSLSTLTMTGERFLVAQDALCPSVSADGTLVYQSGTTGSEQLVWVDRTGKVLSTIGQPQQVLGDPALSPDGRYVAYTSIESGRREVYVKPFPKGEGRLPVSVNGGVNPRWNGRGDELFYVEGNTLMAVTVDTRSGFTAGVPRKLFTGEQVGTRLYDGTSVPASALYDVTADGQWFVVVQRWAEAPRPSRWWRIG